MNFVDTEYELFKKAYGVEPEKKIQAKQVQKKMQNLQKKSEPKKNESKVIQLEVSSSDENEESGKEQVMLESGEGELKHPVSKEESSDSEESEEVKTVAPQINKQAPARISPDLERYLAKKINRPENTKQKPVASEFTFGLIFGRQKALNKGFFGF